MKRKNFVHRAVGWITALCLASSVCTASICGLRTPAVVSAESGSVEDDVGNGEYITTTTEDGFEFELYSDYAVLAKYSGDATDVVIPNTVSGQPVTSISSHGFNWCESLTSIDIPDSITNIEPHNFEFCPNLKEINVSFDNSYYCSVDGVLYTKDISKIVKYPEGLSGGFTIPDSVKIIGDNAFYGCSLLTSVNIHDSVKTIGSWAFEYCTDLKEINVSSDNSYCCSVDGVLYTKDMSEIIKYPEGLSGEFTIPDSVINIGEWAFDNCSSLTSINIPDSVTSIGDCAFYSCTSLTSVNIQIVSQISEMMPFVVAHH